MKEGRKEGRRQGYDTGELNKKKKKFNSVFISPTLTHSHGEHDGR